MSTVKTAVGRFVWHDHVSGDPEAARRFYTELLGWDYDFFDAGDWQYPMIKANGTTHGGFGPTQGDAPPHWLGHVYIDDVDAAAERVEAAGGSIVAPAMDIPDVGRMVVVADPQGAIVSLYHAVSDDFEPAAGRLRVGRADDDGHRGGEALLRRGRRLGEPRHGDGRGQRVHALQLGRQRPRGRYAHSSPGRGNAAELDDLHRDRRRRRHRRQGEEARRHGP